MMKPEDRDYQKRLYTKLRYLLDVYAVNRKHSAALGQLNYGDVNQELLKTKLLDNIKTYRRLTREMRRLPFRVTQKAMVRNGIDEVFNTGADTSRNLHLTLGHPVHAEKRVGRNRSNEFFVTVGYMWFHKVWVPIYNKGLNKLPYVILKATPVRVNNKLMDVYEVTAFDMGTGYHQQGYVAVTKSSRKAFYNLKGATAIAKAMTQITSEIDALLTTKGTQHD